MIIQDTSIPGCYEIVPDKFKDKRGAFVKIYSSNLFESYNLETNFIEQYYSISHQGVLRGLHFQIPPSDHEKLVYVITGNILDAVVDLRKGSPTYGKYETFNLNADTGNMLYIPRGLAHGFYVLSKTAILVYNVTSSHSPEHDTGIHWDSAGIPWPTSQPILSNRDMGFVSLSKFSSPFVYNGELNS
ncbi:dTDP-4-dehydrorhamnose 3,5-epimerase [Metabacillus elymi]|uniref:dTDP-4-dehydrorhamnose 3,5-epimerase n=1 Tax=Metabacillus elymi TaxID=2745198 RepID=A0ABX6S2Z0_9BACI|nr:dTDP-4-dehydrorhamnose 3,5-epimerase [Metabacillus sp. KUDC1714]QNF28469.1 dTDP-4-dehydrorhamnose 3,5-epimerase [Metabacillus sp. KUDC1714]